MKFMKNIIIFSILDKSRSVGPVKLKINLVSPNGQNKEGKSVTDGFSSALQQICAVWQLLQAHIFRLRLDLLIMFIDDFHDSRLNCT